MCYNFTHTKVSATNDLLRTGVRLMNSTRLPLSLVVLLATTTTSVCAQSALDPYEHIKAPASKKTAATGAAEESIPDKTYISMPMGESAEGGSADKKGMFGFMPKVKMPAMGGIGDKFKSAGSAVAEKTKDMGSGIANGAKASGGFMTKPFKGGEKTKVAAKQEDWSKGSKSAGRAASVEDLYVRETKKQIAVADSHKKQKPPKQDTSKGDGAEKNGKSITESTLASMKGAGAATKKLFAPLGKLKPKSNDAPESRPASGFYEGALAKHDQEIAEKSKLAAQQAEAKTAKAQPGTAQPAAKKSKYGMGMLSKMKAPSVPFMGKKDGTKVATKRAQVLDPAAEAAPATSVLDPTAAAAIPAKPAAPAAAPAAATAPAAPATQVAAEPAAAKPAGPGTMAKMTQKMSGSFAAMGDGLAKMNPFKKKGIAEPPKATPVADTNKPAL